jgi:hypothetical protein
MSANNELKGLGIDEQNNLALKNLYAGAFGIGGCSLTLTFGSNLESYEGKFNVIEIMVPSTEFTVTSNDKGVGITASTDSDTNTSNIVYNSPGMCIYGDFKGIETLGGSVRIHNVTV